MVVVRITLRSPASVPRRRRGVLAAALLFKAASRDGFLKHRARQVQQLVMRHEATHPLRGSRPKRRQRTVDPFRKKEIVCNGGDLLGIAPRGLECSQLTFHCTPLLLFVERHLNSEPSLRYVVPDSHAATWGSREQFALSAIALEPADRVLYPRSRCS